ncbi:hypothetical protein [Haloterrigena salifodinae]|uniref:hypothetical protein n=1 Tax=Haloterrigena salifodinae TaxID=2675099 RepID=UPI000F85FDB2|nr:hypothetical protein [Haloterrigena salifodinae]
MQGNDPDEFDRVDAARLIVKEQDSDEMYETLKMVAREMAKTGNGVQAADLMRKEANRTLTSVSDTEDVAE